MASISIIRSVLLATGALLIAGCASQPDTTSLLDKKFERYAKNYEQFQYQGQTVYCKKEKVTTSNIAGVNCLTEAALRERIDSYQRNRNTVTRGGPQYVATVPGG